MARPRTLPDSDVFAVILQRIAAEGEKSVAFSAISRATGLAGASLVQRYGSLAQMVEAALNWGWDELDRMAAAAQEGPEAAALSGAKGAQAFLKGLTDLVDALPMAALLAASLRHPHLRPRASVWKDKVEGLITRHLRDRDAAAMVFAAWQGQVLWEGLETKSFRLKDLVKKLG
jgi:AcrR family transcriptional regulator